MGHENGGWMNADQREAMEDMAIEKLTARIAALEAELAKERELLTKVENLFDDPRYDLSIDKSLGQFECILYDTAGERASESFAPTLSAALSKLVEAAQC